MAPPCKCCTHPQAADISVALLNGATYTGIAGRFGMTRQAVARHVDAGHLGDAIAALELENATMATEAIVEGVMRLHARTLALLAAAEQERDGKAAATLIREARHSLETIATLQLHAPQSISESDAPDIDARIHAALDARLGGADHEAGAGQGKASDSAPGQADTSTHPPAPPTPPHEHAPLALNAGSMLEATSPRKRAPRKARAKAGGVGSGS